MSLLNLPEKFTELRDHQIVAISQIQQQFSSGKKVVFLDAPPGSGKTVIAEYIRQLNKWRAIYTCITKSLQDQFLNDFPYSQVIKGRSNYPTELHPESYPELSASECQNVYKDDGDCVYCDDYCPYDIAKQRAANSPIAVLNLDYLLSVSGNPMSPFVGRDLCIVDECDELESKLMGFVSVEISPRLQSSLNISHPNIKTYDAKDSFECWYEWTERTRSIIKREKNNAARMENAKRFNFYRRLEYKLNILLNSFTPDDNGKINTNWIYVYDSKQKDSSKSPITFKPITVNAMAPHYVFDKQEHFLLMSGTILAPQIEAEQLGLEPEQWGYVNVPSTFAVDNRRIFPLNIGSMAYKNRPKTIPILLNEVQNVVDNHPTERIIIHTHTGSLAKEVTTHLKTSTNRPVFSYTMAQYRETAIKQYKENESAVLVAMSLQRGIDLPGDLCRVQIICMLPRMPINDQQISYRMYKTKTGRMWYQLFTVRNLVQMTGRGVRSKDDYAVTYVMDSEFLGFHRQNERFFPKWWNEAIDWSGKINGKMRTEDRRIEDRREEVGY